MASQITNRSGVLKRRWGLPSKYNFYVLAYRQRIPSSSSSSFVLRTDNWDDYGNKVQFHLSYIDEDGKESRLGAVKILQRTNADGEPIEVAVTTKLPGQFSKLGEGFISLGQEDGYYQDLHSLLGRQSRDVLESLGDIAWLPQLATDFEPTTAFRNALMRENGAHRARRPGRRWSGSCLARLPEVPVKS